MNALILVYLLPLVFSILLTGPYRFREQTITRLSTLSLLLPALVSFFLMGGALFSSHIPFEAEVAKFNIFGHDFPIIIWVDKYSIALLSLTHILGLLVVKYSHGYLHLEKGYQRYFSTILFFIFGMYVLCLSGTMDIFFAGWEIVGFSSFLLIGFYRAHTRSVQNAWRIYCVYRVCDVGLLLGAVMGHVMWHEATRFSVLLDLQASDFVGVHSGAMVVISLMVIFASLGKSAQFPFHNWPARAMEGPTPSSAIFYGALSIHAGVFLLIRTHPIWSHALVYQLIVGGIGLTTLILSTMQEKVQSNIKGQIAFASTAHIGLMFIELSMGFKDLVMLHLFCHALYRCFQLLVSPSIVLDSLNPNNEVVMDRIAKKSNVNKTLYVLAMTEFSLDISWRGFSFLPWKTALRVGRKILNLPLISIPVIIALCFACKREFDLPVTVSAIAFYFAMRALLIEHNAFRSMLDQAIAIVGTMVAVYLLDHHFLQAILSYSVSVVPILIAALVICYKFRGFDLRNYHALGTDNPWAANIFMICFLVMAGMPVSTAFIGEDVILEELLGHSVPITILTMICLLISGLICVKIYTRLFMGRPVHEKVYSRL